MTYPPDLLLISGGLDSVTALTWASQQGHTLRGAISVTYGQRHGRVAEAAAAIVANSQVPHELIALRMIGGVQLTNLADGPRGRDLVALSATVGPNYILSPRMIAYAPAGEQPGQAIRLISAVPAADVARYPDHGEESLVTPSRTMPSRTGRAAPYALECPSYVEES